MLRKLAVVTASIALGAGLVVGVGGTSGAVPPPPPLTGHVTCSFTGNGKIHPKLTTAGSPGGVKITFKGKAFGCTGGSISAGGAVHTVTAGVVKGSGYISGVTGSKCANFEGAAPVDTMGTIKMTVKWILSPAITVALSHVTYGLGGPYSAPVAGTTMSLTLGNPTVGVVYGVTGSYAGSLIQSTVMHVTVPLAGCPVGVPFNFPTGTLAF